MVDAAILRLATTGLDQQQLDRLRTVPFRIAVLKSDLLREFDGRSITLDDNAALSDLPS